MTVEPTKLEPQYYHVLIKQDAVEEKKGSIILADETRESDEFAMMFGTLVKVGELAFTFGTPGSAEFIKTAERPKVGDRVMFRKYAGGQMLKDENGQKYRLMDCSDVIAKVNDD